MGKHHALEKWNCCLVKPKHEHTVNFESRHVSTVCCLVDRVESLGTGSPSPARNRKRKVRAAGLDEEEETATTEGGPAQLCDMCERRPRKPRQKRCGLCLSDVQATRRDASSQGRSALFTSLLKACGKDLQDFLHSFVRTQGLEGHGEMCVLKS